MPNVGNYVGFTTDGTGTTIDAMGVWNTIDDTRYQRNDKWDPIVTNIRASGGQVVEDTDSSRVWHVFALPESRSSLTCTIYIHHYQQCGI